jgi:hypothetical protein
LWYVMAYRSSLVHKIDGDPDALAEQEDGCPGAWWGC